MNRSSFPPCQEINDGFRLARVFDRDTLKLRSELGQSGRGNYKWNHGKRNGAGINHR